MAHMSLTYFLGSCAYKRAINLQPTYPLSFSPLFISYPHHHFAFLQPTIILALSCTPNGFSDFSKI